MSSLFDKLTGKAPLREDPVDAASNESEAKNEVKEEKKGSGFGFKRKPRGPVASNMTERKTDYSYLLVILKWMIPMGVCLVLIIASTFVDSVMNDSLRAMISEQDAQHVDLQNRINMKQTALDNKLIEIEKDASSGRVLSSDKHLEDDAAAEAFFSRYLTWSNSDEYNDLKGEFSMIYKSSPEFVNILFPDEWSGVDPNTYSVLDYIDYEKLNLKFDRVDAYRLGLGDDRISPSYAAIVTASRTRSGGSISTVMFYVEYDVSKTEGSDGEILRGINLKMIVPLVEREDY